MSVKENRKPSFDLSVESFEKFLQKIKEKLPKELIVKEPVFSKKRVGENEARQTATNHTQNTCLQQNSPHTMFTGFFKKAG